nr:unnamed protein product [Spirometra erinaceieuropaei]
MNTPNYGLAKWLFRRLIFLTSDSNARGGWSKQFLKKLKGQDLEVDTIELLLRDKYDETKNHHGHTKIIQILKFCLKAYFTFDGTIDQKVKAAPMGSPTSGLIAEAVLQQLEWLNFRHYRPKFGARYVDDTFVVIERDQMLTFKESLNTVFPDIPFTVEEEENNQLTFLDVFVCRKDCGGLNTKVFREVTNTTKMGSSRNRKRLVPEIVSPSSRLLPGTRLFASTDGSIRLESLTGSCGVANGVTTSEKLGDYSGRI